MDPTVHKTLSIVAFMITFWILEPIDHAVTALIGCYLFWALDVVEFPVAFNGFAKSAPWFLFGALLMGEAASQSGGNKPCIGPVLTREFLRISISTLQLTSRPSTNALGDLLEAA
jgi:di/tricarboxylate transporter